MIIFVTSELKYLIQDLEKRGYEVTSNKDVSCDIIICDLKNNGLLDTNLESNLKPEGTLIIDSGGKNIAQIESIIANRIYSSLY